MMEELEGIKEILKKQGRLIRLPDKGKAIFIGDTHGDLEATEIILKLYSSDYILVFLGDYVDRGKNSRGNIELLLKKKMDTPESIFLLMGNHEAYPILPFQPADFWEGLSLEEKKSFEEVFLLLPFAAVTKNGILALHGVPPRVPSIEEVTNVKLGSEAWYQMTWGDFVDMPGDFFGNIWGRPVYGKDYFENVMKILGYKVLIRAHQPHIQPILFERRCLTLITSSAYKPIRNIAIVDLEKESIESTDDLKVISI